MAAENQHFSKIARQILLLTPPVAPVLPTPQSPITNHQSRHHLFKKFHLNITFRILFIIALVLALVYCAAQTEFYITMFILLALIVICVASLVRYVDAAFRIQARCLNAADPLMGNRQIALPLWIARLLGDQLVCDHLVRLE